MNLKRRAREVIKWGRANYILVLFGLFVLFVSIVGLLRLLSREHQYLYIKVKVSQGLWWASSQRPSVWYLQSIKKGDKEFSLTGRPIAEVIDVRSFPWWSSDQFDVYLTLKLEAEKNERLHSYTYKREPLTIASPIDFDFPSTAINSTVIAISEQPFSEQYVERTVTLSKSAAYLWEYDAILTGDIFSDGQETRAEIVSKSSAPSSSLSRDQNNYSGIMEQRRNITVKMKMKLKEQKGEYFLGEDQDIKVGKAINIATQKFYFDQYIVENIEQ